jgi:hypothetical protein
MLTTKASENPAPARRNACAARPPFDVVLGPYRLAVEFRERSSMCDRRRLACINLSDGRIELRSDLAGLKLARALLDCVIRLSHFSKGCQQGCVEEAYTHGFATGLVEFAQRNPRAWLWFNLLLSEHVPGKVRYDRVVRNAVRRPPPMPRRLHVAGHVVTLRCCPNTGNAFGWYHYDEREARLYSGLTGANLAVVALHEITHAVHHAHALETGARHCEFRAAQLDGWLGIMTQSPAAWRWLAWVISFPEHASLKAA